MPEPLAGANGVNLDWQSGATAIFEMVRSRWPGYALSLLLVLAGTWFLLFPWTYLRFLYDYLMYRKLVRWRYLLWPFYDEEKKLFYTPLVFRGKKLYWRPTAVMAWGVRLLAIVWIGLGILIAYVVST